MKNLFFVLIFFVTAPFAIARQKHYSINDKIQDEAELLTTKIPKDGETCFSPIEHCDLKLIKFLDSAQKSIEIAIYDINLDQLGHVLLVKSKKIPVKIIVDKRQAKEKNSIVETLIKGGVTLEFGHQRGIMHNKFAIVDGIMVETGSFNYTNHASKANNENQVYLANPQTVERYKTRFKEIWGEGTIP